MVNSVILSFASKALGTQEANNELKRRMASDSQGPDGRAKQPLGITDVLTLTSLVITSIASVFSCNVGVAVYSSMLTIIMPLSCLMLHLESDIKDNETKSAFNLFSKLAFVGFVMVASSAFLSSEDDAIINNYIPILNNLTFIGGLSIFLASSFLGALIAGPNILRLVFGLAAASLMVLYRKIFYEISYPIDLHGYFEMLFLGPASCMSVISIFLVYSMMQKLLNAKTNIFATFPVGIAGVIIFAHHFLSEIDSAAFFNLSNVHIHIINTALIFFIFIALVRYFRISSIIAPLSLLSMFACILFDLYRADQGNTIEYFRMYKNFGITISIMSYLAHILFDGGSYLMKSAKIQIIIYALSSLLIILGFITSLGKVFTSISTILFAIFCIINIIMKQRKLENK